MGRKAPIIKQTSFSFYQIKVLSFVLCEKGQRRKESGVLNPLVTGGLWKSREELESFKKAWTKLAVVVHTFDPGPQSAAVEGTAWSTQEVTGQPGLSRDPISKK